MRREVAVYEAVVFEQVQLLHRRAKHDLVPIPKDARLSFGHMRSGHSTNPNLSQKRSVESGTLIGIGKLFKCLQTL
jgi:hypothetical protein